MASGNIVLSLLTPPWLFLGNEQYVETDHGDEYDVKFHWYLEGADVKKPNSTIPVKYDDYGQHPKDVLICDS